MSYNGKAKKQPYKAIASANIPYCQGRKKKETERLGKKKKGRTGVGRLLVFYCVGRMEDWAIRASGPGKKSGLSAERPTRNSKRRTGKRFCWSNLPFTSLSEGRPVWGQGHQEFENSTMGERRELGNGSFPGTRKTSPPWRNRTLFKGKEPAKGRKIRLNYLSKERRVE